MLLTPGIRKRFTEEEPLFFTSDTHFFHRAMLTFGREFNSVEHMNEVIFHNWNAVVPKDGHVFHLGDLSFGSHQDTYDIIKKLNGIKYLVVGNHDRQLSTKVSELFNGGITPYHEISVGSQKICLFHFPIASWNGVHHGSWNLHGHSHGNYEGIGKQLDVGVDPNHMTPLNYGQVKNIMKNKELATVDHHKPKN